MLPFRGITVVVLTALACLAYTALRDTPTLSLQRMASGSILMSCAESTPASAEPLWCSDPSSPHCLPAVPQAPRAELSDHPDLWVTASLEAAPTLAFRVLSSWPRSLAETPRGLSHVHRLERPPRA